MSYEFIDPICDKGILINDGENCKCKIKKTKTINKQTDFLNNHEGPLYFKESFIKTTREQWKKGEQAHWSQRYGPNKGRCRKGFLKNPDDKFCYTFSPKIMKNNTLKKKVEQKKNKTIKKIKPTVKSKTLLSQKTIKKTKTKTKTIKKIKTKKPTKTKTIKTTKTSKIIKKEYSPSLNKKLLSLKTFTPKSYIHNCLDTDVLVKTKTKKKCMKFTSAKAKKTMLDNLLSKAPVDCSKIIAPKQFQSNCWMNSFFMAWFISDKGRKFNRWIRETMITGIKPNGEKISKKLKKPMWLLNKMIDASLRGSRIQTDGYRYASLMDTNTIIRSFHRSYPNSNFAKTKTASNPLTFYKKMYELVSGDFMPWGLVEFGKYVTSEKITKKLFNRDINNTFVKWGLNNFDPKIIFIVLYDDQSIVNKSKKITFKNKTYSLDAIVIRNTEKHHFVACVTCNKKEYCFDGGSFSTMVPYKWKNDINKNKDWTLSSSPLFFNFKKGYQILMYYRV